LASAVGVAGWLAGWLVRLTGWRWRWRGVVVWCGVGVWERVVVGVTVRGSGRRRGLAAVEVWPSRSARRPGCRPGSGMRGAAVTKESATALLTTPATPDRQLVSQPGPCFAKRTPLPAGPPYPPGPFLVLPCC
jgi:hypothetical protein